MLDDAIMWLCKFVFFSMAVMTISGCNAAASNCSNVAASTDSSVREFSCKHLMDSNDSQVTLFRNWKSTAYRNGKLKNYLSQAICAWEN